MLVLSVHWWPTPTGVGRVLGQTFHVLAKEAKTAKWRKFEPTLHLEGCVLFLERNWIGGLQDNKGKFWSLMEGELTAFLI